MTLLRSCGFWERKQDRTDATIKDADACSGPSSLDERIRWVRASRVNMEETTRRRRLRSKWRKRSGEREASWRVTQEDGMLRDTTSTSTSKKRKN